MTTLLDKFFAPLSFSAASAAAIPGVAAALLDHSILPPFSDNGSTDGEDAWATVWVAEIPLPPVGMGKADLKTPIKIKVDKATKTGAAKPKVKNTGGEAIEGTITVKFGQVALPAMVAAAKTLYPGAGPFPIRHPKATMAQLDAIEIVGWSDAPDPDDYGEFTWVLQYLQVSMTAQNGSGSGSAVKTPKVVQTFIQPGDTDGDGHLLNANGDIIPGGSGEASAEAVKEAAKAGAAP